MGRKQVFTENSHFWTKIRVRKEAVERVDKDQIHVLDAFAGQGLVWREMQNQFPDRRFTVLGIDKKKYHDVNVIMGENVKVMKGLDLSDFDLIDLDAFGCPAEQLAICARKALTVPVVTTHISVTLGPVPKELLQAGGIPDDWRLNRNVPKALFGRWRWEWWENYCAHLGYTETHYELHLDKSAVKRYETLYSLKGA